MKKDIVWLDYARFIGIYLVIFGHLLQRWPEFSCGIIKSIWDYIYMFHMPLFFIISGYLFKNDKTQLISVRIKKIFYSLIIPYLLYQLVYFPVVLLKNGGIYNTSILFKILMGIILGDGYETSISLPVNLPCWFIICIIQLRLLFIFIPINKISSFILSIFSILTLVLLKFFDIDLYFCLDSTLMAIPYFIFGHYIAKKEIIENLRHNIRFIVCLLLFVAVYVILKYNGSAQMNGPSFGDNIILNYFAGISGTIGVFIISNITSNFFNKRKIIYIISRNTLFIIFFHWIVLDPFKFVILVFEHFDLKWISNPVSIIIMTFIGTIVILSISVMIIERFRNKIPLFFGKTK